MRAADFCKRLNLICGHYGSGKTNLAVNLAVDLRRQGKEVTLVDLDVVNPYFRSADFTAGLEAIGIRTVCPCYANTNLDIPGITAEVYSVFESGAGTIIIDVGGDDAGAAALGRYTHMLPQEDYTMLCVLNARRYLTRGADEAAAILNQISATSRMRVTGLVNNTNLGAQTTAQTVLESILFAEQTATRTSLPLVATAYASSLEAELAGSVIPNGYPVSLYVRPPWEEPASINL